MDESQAIVVDPRRTGIDWDGFISVIVQTLYAVGYENSAQWLECDIPGFHQSLEFVNLRSQFLGGFWEKCAQTLCSVMVLSQDSVNGALLIILSMWLVERLALDRNFRVSKVLQNDFTSRMSLANREGLARIVADIDTLANGLNDLRVALELRKRMLMGLELSQIYPSVAPTLDNRLFVLINYGIDAQIHSCLSHNRRNECPQFCDHSCRNNHLPTKTIQILTGHDKKIWTVKFSHNGLYLASGSHDCTAIIWEVPDGWELRKKHVLRGHNEAITCVSWSPNDELLLTCAPKEHIKLWDVLTGQCTRVISDQDQVLKSCVFLNSDPIKIVYGTAVERGSIRLLTNESDSELVLFPILQHRLTVDFVVTPDGKKLIYYHPNVNGEWFTVKNLDTGHINSIKEEARILGISVSEDSEYLILNLSNDEIHVWDLESLEDKPLAYWDFKRIIDGNIPCFGGFQITFLVRGFLSGFLVSGTQDAKVCIWNRRQARPIAILSGHTSVVRCVSWNPQRHQMLASASDDNTIRIWGPQSQEVPQLLRHD